MFEQASELVDALRGGVVGAADHGLKGGAQPDEFRHTLAGGLCLVAQVGELGGGEAHAHGVGFAILWVHAVTLRDGDGTVCLRRVSLLVSREAV